MSRALFINGIFEGVLTPILEAQSAEGGGEFYVQPYRRKVIASFRRDPPTPSTPVPLYLSTTKNRNNICYTAEVVGWEDKRELSESRKQAVLQRLEQYQPKECGLLRGDSQHEAVNLIRIRNLRRLVMAPPTSVLIKKSDDLPLKERKRAGGWSEVYARYDLEVFFIPVAETQQQADRRLAEEVEQASALETEALEQRLAGARRVPERVQMVSVGFRRNADVIVAVLRRANDTCERCRRPAPFLRRADGSPFLEVHHRTPLAAGGEDTVGNAMAVCPNCHREAHYG